MDQFLPEINSTKFNNKVQFSQGHIYVISVTG